MPAATQESTEVVEPVADKIAVQAAHDSLIDKMKKHYAKEKRVPVKVRAESDVPVQVNGYTFLIKPGERVMVPESIAKLLEDADYI